MRGYSSKESLLASQDDLSSVAEDVLNARPLAGRRSHLNSLFAKFLVLTLLLSSVLLNVVLWLRDAKNQSVVPKPHSLFSGLGHDMAVTYQSYSDYWDDGNHTVSDSLWDAIDTSPIAVALTDEYAREKGLPVTTRFPWDYGKGVYYIKVYHLMHCLKIVRKVLVDYERGNIQTIRSSHVHHCLDALRQDTMCQGDDTPMPTIKDNGIGDGQIVQCRDLNALQDWIYSPERNACFRTLDEYKTVKHSLEEFAFCGKSSPYYTKMTAYFDYHGHKDPYVS